MFTRQLQKTLQTSFFQGKVLIIVGPRQVGKTTLVWETLEKLRGRKKIRALNCDNPMDRELLEEQNLFELQKTLGDNDILFIDEGHKVKTIGQSLKILVDHYKKSKQVIVTSSSSLNLLNKTSEPLTGRKKVFFLYPLSIHEIIEKEDYIAFERKIESFLIYGAYPEVVTSESAENKVEILTELTSSYLYKDIFEFQDIKNPEILTKLLKALALQIGSEVSYTELANLLSIGKNTVERYIDLLEKNYIIFRLPPYTANKRKEISKMRKIYFYDIGIRNAIINNFNPFDSRADIGKLWENFMIVQRMMHREYDRIRANQCFWRTYDGAEVDLVEDRQGKLFGYEFTWRKVKKKNPPQSWLSYKNASFEVVTKENVFSFLS